MISQRSIGNKIYKWNSDKDERLQEVRWFGFQDICDAIESNNILADIPHPNQNKYPHQHKFIVQIDDYAYDVPYVLESNIVYFFKTAIPSRKSTKEYILSSK